MSATLDAATDRAVPRRRHPHPREGRRSKWRSSTSRLRRAARGQVAAAVRRLVREGPREHLVFLGAAEIHRAREAVGARGLDIDVVMRTASLPPSRTAPSRGSRTKVILAPNVAERRSPSPGGRRRRKRARADRGPLAVDRSDFARGQDQPGLGGAAGGRAVGRGGSLLAALHAARPRPASPTTPESAAPIWPRRSSPCPVSVSPTSSGSIHPSPPA